MIDINDDSQFADWMARTLTISEILQVAGIWEILSEEYNNDWIEFVEKENEKAPYFIYDVGKQMYLFHGQVGQENNHIREFGSIEHAKNWLFGEVDGVYSIVDSFGNSLKMLRVKNGQLEILS